MSVLGFSERQKMQGKSKNLKLRIHPKSLNMYHRLDTSATRARLLRSQLVNTEKCPVLDGLFTELYERCNSANVPSTGLRGRPIPFSNSPKSHQSHGVSLSSLVDLDVDLILNRQIYIDLSRYQTRPIQYVEKVEQ